MENSNKEDKDCDDASDQTITRMKVGSNMNNKALDLIQ